LVRCMNTSGLTPRACRTRLRHRGFTAWPPFIVAIDAFVDLIDHRFNFLERADSIGTVGFVSWPAPRKLIRVEI
jgi:hypothetical protein